MISNLTNTFQMGWNHHLVILFPPNDCNKGIDWGEQDIIKRKIPMNPIINHGWEIGMHLR